MDGGINNIIQKYRGKYQKTDQKRVKQLISGKRSQVWEEWGGATASIGSRREGQRVLQAEELPMISISVHFICHYRTSQTG